MTDETLSEADAGALRRDLEVVAEQYLATCRGVAEMYQLLRELSGPASSLWGDAVRRAEAYALMRMTDDVVGLVEEALPKCSGLGIFERAQRMLTQREVKPGEEPPEGTGG